MKPQARGFAAIRTLVVAAHLVVQLYLLSPLLGSFPLEITPRTDNRAPGLRTETNTAMAFVGRNHGHYNHFLSTQSPLEVLSKLSIFRSVRSDCLVRKPRHESK